MTRLIRVVPLIIGILLAILLKHQALFLLGIAIAVCIAVCLIIEHLLRRKSMETLALENTSREYVIQSWVRYFKANKVRRELRDKLDELKKNNPQRVWGSLEILLANLPNQLITIQAHLTAAGTSMTRGWEHALNTSRQLSAAETHLKRVCELPDLIAAKHREIHHAASIFPELRLEVNKAITKLRRLTMYPQVSEDIRERLKEAEEEHKKDLLKIKPGLTDWVEAANDLKATKNILAAIYRDMGAELNRSA